MSDRDPAATDATGATRRNRDTAQDARPGERVAGDAAVTQEVQPQALLHQVLESLLFADIAPEEAEALGAAARRRLTEAAWKLLQRRLPGRAVVRLKRLPAHGVPKALAGQTLLLALNDDMPFLVDSLRQHVTARGLGPKLLLHPVLRVRRDADGRLLAIERRAGATRATETVRPESLIVMLLEPLAERQAAVLQREIADILAEVRAVVLDFPAMRERLQHMIEAWQRLPPPVPVSELTEMLAFLQWLADEHFVFLGARFLRRDADGALHQEGEGLGLLRRRLLDEISGEECADCAGLMPCRGNGEQAPLLITRSAAISRVHRRVPMDLIIIRQHDVAGGVSGELRLLGLFTAAAYVRAAQDIPLLRRKVMAAQRISGLDATGHRGKALLNILQTLPRDDLFELSPEALARLALQVLQVQQRPRPRLLIWRGCSPLFAAAFAFIPRERFSSDLRERVGALLETELGAQVVQFTPSFDENLQVRVHYRLRLLQPDGWQPPPQERLDALLADVVRSWEERLQEEMQARLGAARAEALWPLYRDAFSEAYKEAFSPAEALHDVRMLEALAGSTRLAVKLHRAAGDADDVLRLKLYHFGAPVPLAVRVPMLAHFGLQAVEERTFTVERHGGDGHGGSGNGDGDADGRDDDVAMGRPVFIHEMLLRPADGMPTPAPALMPLLEEGFLAVWNRQADDDRFNALMLAAGLHWRQVVVLRACARWLRQAGVHYSLGYMADTLCRHPGLARRLVEMFETLLRPGRAGAATRRRRAEALRTEIVRALASVPSLDEDRIIRMLAATIMAMRRSNFWQPATLAEGGRRPFAFKLRGEEVDFIARPRPWAEVFVHDPELEGVHLRGGPIARGGIRFSDRPQDFRTEILGLMKAQTVKNALIVPVGAKGGFVLRRPPAQREALRAAARAAYERFIATLVEMTDNITPAGICPPRRLARLDGDDPYLVVAADKGTASFSDIANAIARRRDFWLDDAFASGGSSGYDHKKMGITARGAWVCVRQHFRELDIDIDATPISVVGVGDMSGDVFGNGMLIQPDIRLLAAFDHRDIFIDPDPDMKAAFAERRRLFRLPRSSWQDYDRSRISAGGGVFSRQAKSIPLSPQVKALLGVSADALTPDELIRAILRMPADLLWFGGIGTFVRDAAESDAAVGDPANDAVRITADELRVKVVGEGANLGMTQAARIRFAAAGGRVNMDAIDNAGGVHCSDVEVNIKIALREALRAERLTMRQRDALLARMEPAVARLVLDNCRRQAVCISMSAALGAREAEELQRLMQQLQERGVLDRRLERLPDDAALRARIEAGEGLTRPEIAVLMSWAKIVLFDDLLACGVVDDAALHGWLTDYFPEAMRADFAAEIDGHRLRREIIANRLANAMIHLGGPGFVLRLTEETGRDVRAVASAFAVACALFELPALADAVMALDGRLRGADQLRLWLDLRHALRRACLWLLRHEADCGRAAEGIAALLRRHAPVIDWLRTHLRAVATAHARQRLRRRREEFAGLGVPKPLAARLAVLPYLLRGPEIARVRQLSGASLRRAAGIYFQAGARLRLSAVIMAARRLRPAAHEERLAVARLLDRLAALHVRLAAAICRRPEEAVAAAVDGWMAANEALLRRITPRLEALLGGAFSLPKLALAASLFEELAETVSTPCDPVAPDTGSDGAAEG